MKTRMLKTVLFASLIALMGCNTVTGVGEDIEAGGEKMQTKSKEVQRDM